MKLAVSNIAWPAEQDAAVAARLKSLGVRGIEVAPTRLFPNPLDASDADIDAVVQFWKAHGISIVAAQSLLFGRPDLTLFESEEKRRETHAYLSAIIQLCAKLGAGPLVFGSPKNRRRGDMPHDDAMKIAAEFFDDLADIAAAEETVLVFEANPQEYGADFCTNYYDSITLVAEVGHPCFRLHLDTACMTLAGDSFKETFDAAGMIHHVHISGRHLAPPSPTDGVDHLTFAKWFRKHRPSGWVSLEMRAASPFDLDAFAATVAFVKETYRV